MAQNYRIYINDNTLFISEVLPEQKEKIQQLEFQDFDLQTFYKKLKNGSKKSYLFLTKNPEETFKKLKKNCEIIKAAGGLVESANGNYLFIFRNKKWDLPKGKLEFGEKMKETAVREVEEECGIKVLKREDKLCKTYHVYQNGSKMVIKKTNWYKMTVKGEPKLVPQKEEGIDEAVWLDKNHLLPVVKNTFPSIMDVMRAGGIL
ncbi:NUDIX domain-containing protein [Pedobacter petrophilus]|uniref:NUDIX domain-containing protein n=1 Tax=Pedobacter petrophilus TaxID=1908241 RepID=A0A7K0G2M2_9SPHI|nr:NUDIX domain-containing protein [Pedobacter petrophilus]MRX78067.1 NUDIX domain-containing protein [Pedobacter petrophilus]